MDNSTQGKQELEPLDIESALDAYMSVCGNPDKELLSCLRQQVRINVEAICNKFGTPKQELVIKPGQAIPLTDEQFKKLVRMNYSTPKTKTVPLASLMKTVEPKDVCGDWNGVSYREGFNNCLELILSLNNFNVTVVEENK